MAMRTAMAGSASLRQFAIDRCVGWVSELAERRVLREQLEGGRKTHVAGSSSNPVPTAVSMDAAAAMTGSVPSGTSSDSIGAVGKGVVSMVGARAGAAEGVVSMVGARAGAAAAAEAMRQAAAMLLVPRTRLDSMDSEPGDDGINSESKIMAPTVSFSVSSAAGEAREVELFSGAADDIVRECTGGKRQSAPDGVGALLWAVSKWRGEHEHLLQDWLPGFGHCSEPTVGPRLQLMMPDHVDVSEAFIRGSVQDKSVPELQPPAPRMILQIEPAQGASTSAQEMSDAEAGSSAATAGDKAGSFGKLQFMELGIDRFAIPEVMLNPPDAGVQQRGIADAIADSVRACPFEL